jgi:hypothetical protein
MRVLSRSGMALLVPVVLAVLPACAPAIGAAVGAAAAIAYDERNASATITAPVATVAQTTANVFTEMGVQQTFRGEEGGGTSATLRGTHEGANVTVEITRESANASRVVVTAREGEVGYRPSQAGRILQRIIDRS